MSKITKKILGASLSLAAFSFSYTQNVQAQSCVVLPTCEALGYTDSSELCENGELLRCPFDESKVFCRSVPKTKTKACDTIGDVLLDDKTCAADISNILGDRTPIGIVFDTNKRLAIALEETSQKWTSIQVDCSGLTNYNSETAAKGDYNGKNNTITLIGQGDRNGYETPAADYAYNYTTKGTKQGDWYLPAGGELYLIAINTSTINNTLSKIDKTTIGGTYWSSTELNQYGAYSTTFGGRPSYSYTKTYSNGVRPIIVY